MTAAARRAAVPVRLRTAAVISMASLLGLVAFLWPFVIRPGSFGDRTLPLIMFAGLLALVIAVVFADLADGGIDSKALAMLGVLSAVGAALRPLGAGTAGIETVFFIIVLAGRVFGPGFGFVLGCTTLFSSALITGGVGPWLPYQMFGCAWVGMLAGLLPPLRGRAEVALLAVYGSASAYLYGFLLNLSTWPFTIDPSSSISYVPGAAIGTNLAHYLAYDTTTSLGWDTGRALTNLVCIVAFGPAFLYTFRRAARRAAFQKGGSWTATDASGSGRGLDQLDLRQGQEVAGRRAHLEPDRPLPAVDVERPTRRSGR